jgi:DNA-binding phage protein
MHRITAQRPLSETALTGPESQDLQRYDEDMVRREIEIDEDTDRILTELASEYKGDLSLALADLVLAREGMEEFAQHSEAEHENALRALRDRSEADFREGRTVTWDDVKSHNGL